MRFDQGWIKLHRSAVTEDIGRSGIHIAVWVTLLCWATRFESKIRWQGKQRTLPPGSVVTGIRDLASHLGFSKDSVSRAIHALAARESISVETATRGTLVIICNWAQYQERCHETATPARHERDTGETQAGRGPDLNGEVRSKKKDNTATDPTWDFEAIYLRYPRKLGKSAGLAKLKKQALSQEEFGQLGSALGRFIDHHRSAGTESQFLPYFSKWVTNWQDWLDVDVGKSEQMHAPTINVTPIRLEGFG